MADVVTHEKVSVIADGADATRIRPSNWNGEHKFAGGVNDGDCLVWKSSESDKVKFAPILLVGTRTIFDQDTAPLGWVRDNDLNLNDRTIRLVSGSRGPNGGSWTISGMTASDAGAHAHSTGNGIGSPFAVGSGAGEAISLAHTHNTNTQGSHTHPVGSDGTWRPLHRDMIVCSKSAV